MKRLVLLLALLFATPAWATLVSSGHADFATATNTSCVPNGGGVTTGHELVMFVQANSATSIAVTGSLSTWGAADQTETQAGGTVFTYSFHAPATGSGAETIIATFSSSTGLIGSDCFEFTSTGFDSSNATSGTGGLSISVTTTHAVVDLVGFVTNGVANSATIVAPFTPQQTISFGGNIFCASGNQHVSVIGTYPFSPTGSGTGTVHLLALFSSGAASLHHQPQVIRYKEIHHDPIIQVSYPAGAVAPGRRRPRSDDGIRYSR